MSKSVEKKTNNNSYYLQRLHDLGITPEINEFEVPAIVTRHDEATNTYSHEKKDYSIKHKVFEQVEDDIRINYHRLTGAPYHWKKPDSRTPHPFFRTRLKVPKEYIGDDGKKTQMKYSQARGSGHLPFFTPWIIKKYLDQTEIETLYIIEGEFKAFKGGMSGIDIIGIPSIHGFYASDVPGKLHEDIQELMLACKVKKVVYLTDADTLSVNWEEGKDLKKRVNSFYSAVKNFRNSLQLLLDSDDFPLQVAYFMHMRSSLMDTAKGLDDLFCALPAKKAEIVSDIYQMDLAKKYFSGKNITSNRYGNDLINYFGLVDVERFYNLYKKFIGTREFRYGKSRYQWDGEKVSHVRHEDADTFFRVGADWMKVIKVPNKNHELEDEIIPFKISEITRDYKHHPDFIDQLQRFDAFCNVPNWNGAYRRKHGECYNLCNAINHEPKAGSIAHTVTYLKHLFGGHGWIRESADVETQEYHHTESCMLGDPFTVALDYLTLQYQNPTHKLPVPILVSPEQGTGKSTFLKWLRAIYGSNATILDNDRFKMNFNSHYITKFIIGLDEGFLDIEKKAEKEKLKQIATADEAFLERKGIDIKKFPYYGKLIICSNDADKVMQMDTEDRRWFVVRVPKLKRKNPFLEEWIKAEIPAWLHFLKNRKVVHPKEDDLWFRTEYIITEQFNKIVEVTKSRIDKVVESFLKDMFLTYRLPVIRMDLKSMLEQLNDPKVAKYKIDEKDLVYYLEERKKMSREQVQRMNIPYGYDAQLGSVLTTNKVGRPFVFRHEEWLSAEEVEEFNSANDLTGMIPAGKKDTEPAAAGADKPDEDLPF